MNYPSLLAAISPPRMNTDEGGRPRNCSLHQPERVEILLGFNNSPIDEAIDDGSREGHPLVGRCDTEEITRGAFRIQSLLLARCLRSKHLL